MSGQRHRLGRPSGAVPPAEAALTATGQRIALEPLAREVSRRYALEFPDEAERHGEHWFEWCVHDLQYVLAWAVHDENGLPVLDDQLAWLGRVLAARDHPAGRLARAVELAADVVQGEVPTVGERLAERLRASARELRWRHALS